jgi:glycosyltransferase involved in cell wall biosynthesis
MNSIGVGLITYKAPVKLAESGKSVPIGLHSFVIVNDGTPYDASVYPAHSEIIQHEQNGGVAAAKNSALRRLMEMGCEHLFLMEDDVVIKNPEVFDEYIKLYEATGIKHFNFALQGHANFRRFSIRLLPWNLLLTKQIVDSSGQKLVVFNESDAIPSPRIIVSYPDKTRIALYPTCPGAFSYYHRTVIESVGLLDEQFKNAGEHLEHTLRIIKGGFHPPYWWFADLVRADRYLKNIDDCMQRSTIRSDPQWAQWIIQAEQYYRKKHGFSIHETPRVDRNDVELALASIYGKFKNQSEAKIKLRYLRPWLGLAY